MRPFASTIGLDDALAIMSATAVPIARRERVSLDRASGRVLATAIVAQRDVPPFDRSAMDGYAVRASDTAAAHAGAPVFLTIADTVFAGQASQRPLERGECAAIATGAPLPPGADAVVMVEHTSAEPGGVRIVSPAATGQHVGRRAADIATGDRVLEDGALLDAARVGAIAALGIGEVDVYARPRVFVASTGNELVAPGEPLTGPYVYDINRFSLAAIVGQHGGEVIVGATVGDSVQALRQALDDADDRGADIVLLSGGSSVGDRDLLVDAVAERGEVLFHGIAVKPGKPTLFARLRRSLLLGMPGNPTSCLSNAYILLIPLLRAVARLPGWRPQTHDATLARDVRNASGRHTFFTVRLDGDVAIPAFKGSGDITSLAHADGYIEIPAEVTSLPAGSRVLVTRF